MRIPLDYYRILGLPTQATAEQIQQAHQDRTMQLPRREYSEPAIAAHRELLDEAYSVLAGPGSREEYDKTFLASTTNLSQRIRGGQQEGLQTTGITVEDHQVIGALLLLQELGEYELVLKLGQEYLTKLKSHNPGVNDVEMISADVSLTVALSYLELGREHWQQSHYEEAAEALEAGQDLLFQEGLFAGVRSEVRSDLYRLRPYRVLELISQPMESVEQRKKGIQILEEMLQERGGIDGSGSDQSGLDTDDFLRFIQQLRDYLTAEEQQMLFEKEARRPSAVASYLAVYALMARGFIEQKPDLVLRAKRILAGLSGRQDVHLEQSVCALMLGQTEEANRALEYSQEYEPLAFIREHSEGSPDLLPGLCIYAERWLHDEVFQNFRDLKGQTTSLKDYFANPEVQNALEALPAETVAEVQAAPSVEMGHGWSGEQQTNSLGSPAQSTLGNTATLAPPDSNSHSNGAGSLAAGTAVVAGAVAGGSAIANGIGLAERNGISHNGTESNGTVTYDPDIPPTQAYEQNGGNSRIEQRRQQRRQRRREAGAVAGRGRSTSSIKIGRLLLLIGGGLFALWLIFAILSQIFGWLSNLGSGSQTNQTENQTLVAKLEKNQPSISLQEPVIDLLAQTASSTPSSVTASGPLSEAAAEQVIKLWLGTKTEVFGKEQKSELLENILTGDALTRWAGEAELSKQDGTEVRYQHKLAINKVESNSADQATVIATVTELAKYYQGGEITRNRQDRDLKVRYELVRDGDSWKITNMAVN